MFFPVHPLIASAAIVRGAFLMAYGITEEMAVPFALGALIAILVLREIATGDLDESDE